MTTPRKLSRAPNANGRQNLSAAGRGKGGRRPEHLIDPTVVEGHRDERRLRLASTVNVFHSSVNVF